MRYTVTKQIIQVLGSMWMGGTAAMEYTLDGYQMEQIADPYSREDVARYVAMHSGDFQSITDFRADFTLGRVDIVHEWQSEENEMTFNDCMYPMED